MGCCEPPGRARRRVRTASYNKARREKHVPSAVLVRSSVPELVQLGTEHVLLVISQNTPEIRGGALRHSSYHTRATRMLASRPACPLFRVAAHLHYETCCRLRQQKAGVVWPQESAPGETGAWRTGRPGGPKSYSQRWRACSPASTATGKWLGWLTHT